MLLFLVLFLGISDGLEGLIKSADCLFCDGCHRPALIENDEIEDSLLRIVLFLSLSSLQNLHKRLRQTYVVHLHNLFEERGHELLIKSSIATSNSDNQEGQFGMCFSV